MDWVEFLEDLATQYELSHDQQQALIARFDPKNSSKTEKQIADQTKDDKNNDRFAGEAAFKKLMTEVYRKLQPFCPELETLAKGKQLKLKAFLQEKFKQQQSIPDLPIPRSVATGLKVGAPFPGVRLPDNFVPRLEFDAVKQKLLAEDDRALVVSAIAGLGGLGKSVLATALVLDNEVQTRFADGILWVTLGQNPESRLQSLLGDCIYQLDKSQKSYSATTLEDASSYLHTLLLDKRVLLVVDNAWNGAHVEYFRVGGAKCQLLVTTRTAFIPGAKRHDLKVMSPDEALELIQRTLGQQWTSAMKQPAQEFAQLLGWLPLALQLMATQVARGRQWENLRKAFLDERERLRTLDRCDVKLNQLSEEEQCDYSLRSCLQLSLKWLEPELLEKFTWLGVLPGDATIQESMAVTLWNLSDWEAEKTLLDLYDSSLLSRGIDAWKDKPTYRIHDLLQTMAEELIQKPQTNDESGGLPGLGLSPSEAQAQILERYRDLSTDRRWDRLPNDGYIHRHLVWHLEQAGLEDEIHTLMAMSDEQGRNAWFEACDRLGQPAIFVQDVKRGWAIAEQSYEEDNTRSIVLQCQYALITATLNSLVANLPIGMMATFVQRGYWTSEQAWAYVEQMQDEDKVAEAVRELAPHLPESIFGLAVEKTRSLQDENLRASALSALAQINSAYFSEALAAAQSIQDENLRASVLSALTQIDSADFAQLLAAARSIQNEYFRASVLSALAQINSAYFSEALAAARSIQNENLRASVLSALGQIDSADFSEALAEARSIQDENTRALVLSALAQIDSAYFSEALAAARSIQDENTRASALSALAQIDSACFSEALAAARSIQDENLRAEVLSALAQIDSADFAQLLAAARSIQDESSRAEVLSALAQIDSADFAQLLAAARSIQDENLRASALSALAQIDSADFAQLLAAARSIQDENLRASALSALAQIDSAYFSEALAAARSIQNENLRASASSALAQIDSAYFSEALAAARSIQNEDSRASALSALVQIDSADFAQLLAAARSIQNEDSRAWALSALVQIDSADFAQLSAAARSIQDESSRARVLSALAQINLAYFSEALAAARSIQDEYIRVRALSALAQINLAYFSEALAAARSIQNESRRAEVLSALAQINSAYFSEALAAVRSIQDEYIRAWALSALAQIDSADFAQLLAEARSIQNEYRRVWVLSALAQINSADFAQLLAEARSIQNEDIRARVLSALAKKLPELLVLLAFAAIDTIIHKSSRARAYRAYLPRLSLVTLSHPDWQSTLHLLAHRDRADLITDLATLHPAILHLGGAAAIRGMVDAMRDVCQQWK